MPALLQESPPIVHWCDECGTYLNIPVESSENGRRLAECPYCGEFLCETIKEPVMWYRAVSPRV